MIQYAEMKKPDLIQLFLDHGFKMENMTNDAAKEYVNSISNCKALDWDRLKELSKGRKGKFEYDSGLMVSPRSLLTKEMFHFSRPTSTTRKKQSSNLKLSG